VACILHSLALEYYSIKKAPVCSMESKFPTMLEFTIKSVTCEDYHIRVHGIQFGNHYIWLDMVSIQNGSNVYFSLILKFIVTHHTTHLYVSYRYSTYDSSELFLIVNVMCYAQGTHTLAKCSTNQEIFEINAPSLAGSRGYAKQCLKNYVSYGNKLQNILNKNWTYQSQSGTVRSTICV
jgi:hypothetical protein